MKSKKYKGGTLKREKLFSDPYEIHKLRLAELSKSSDLVEYMDYNEIKEDSESVNILYVIDMQNDFIQPGGAKETDGQFPVLGGNTIVEPLIKFISDNKDNFGKIIFSRDYHEEKHCGFKPQGMHPPHCVQTRFGAQFEDKIRTFLTCELLNKKDSDDYKKTEIVFKAMKMESFGASKATNGKGKWYNTHDSCREECNDLHMAKKWAATVNVNSPTAQCLKLTGGFKLDNSRPKTDSIGDSMMTEDLTEKYDIEDVVGEFPNKTYNIYITGLAGCHCVSETATNIADYFNSIGNLNYQIYIIEDLTRYAFVPLSVNVNPKTYFTEESINKMTGTPPDNPSRDDLSYYIFKNEDLTFNFKLLTKGEVDTQKGEIVSCAMAKTPGDKSFFNYFHYLVPLKDTIDTYKKYSDKIKLLMNPDDENLKETLREPAKPATIVSGGRKNKTKKKRKSIKKRKSTKRKRPIKKRR